MYTIEFTNGEWAVKVSNGILETFPTEQAAKDFVAYMNRMDRINNA